MRTSRTSLLGVLLFLGAVLVLIRTPTDRARSASLLTSPVEAAAHASISPDDHDSPKAAAPSSRETVASAASVGFAPSANDPRAVIASAWRDDTRTEQVAFREWTERYLAADTDSVRDALVAEGLRLAQARRVALARLIVTNPEAALASAVPIQIRGALPASIVAKLEKRISARGELALNAVTPAPGSAAPAESSFHTALVGGAEYRAYVYGRRSTQATILDAALNGIAIDRVFAVTESPVRLLEPGEVPVPSAPPLTTCAACAAASSGDASSQRIRYEYAGAFGAAENTAHFEEDAAALEAAERDLTAADNQPGTYTVVGRPSRTWTHGPKKILIIRVDFPDLPGTPESGDSDITPDDAVQRISEAGGVGDFYQASSFGKTSLVIRSAVNGVSPDVTPVLHLTRSATSYAVKGDHSSLHSDARAAALAAGFDSSTYDRVGVVFSNLSGRVDDSDPLAVKTSKFTWGGLATVMGPNFWVNGFYTFRVVAHELGHTYGLRHANLWKVFDGNPASESGESREYGDPFDIMGGGEGEFNSIDDFGPWNKSILQWIPDSAVTVAGVDGTYRVHAFDSAGADLSLPRALKIVRDPTRDYWIGYRRATDSASLDNGLYVVWGYNANKQGDLLDLSTPGTDPKDAALPVGVTFDDSAAGIAITPLSQGGSGADEWVDVQVVIRPRVQWVSTQILAAEQGAMATLTLRRSGSSAGPLSVSYATEDGTAQAPSDYASVSGSVSWADGETVDKTITVPLVADGVVERSESFKVGLGTVSGGARVGPAIATVTIAEVGASDATFRSDFISSTVYRLLPLPDGSVVAGGAFTTLQDSAGAIYKEIVGRIARFKPDGTMDVDFDFRAGANSAVRALAIQADGCILVGGDFTAYAGAPAGGIVRIFPDGSVDSSFKPGAGANKTVHDIVVQPDGRILVAGAFTSFNGVSRNRVVRLAPDGQIDGSFANPAFSATVLRSLSLQPDGKVIVAGGLSYSGLSGEGFKSGVARLNANGSRDAGFDVGFGAHTSGATNTLTTVFRVAIQADGRIIVVGDFTGFGGFKGSARRNIARLSSSGAVDTAFAPRPSNDPAAASVVALRLLPGNRFLVGGAFTKVGTVDCAHLALINENGSVDEAFAAAGGHGGTVADFALLPDGKVLLAGDPDKFQESTLVRAIWRVIPGLSGAPGTIAFSDDTYMGREGGTAVLTVRRVGGSLGQVRVAYAAARAKVADTATADTDYTLPAGTLSWADGDGSERTIAIPLTKDDVADEGEVFTVRLGEPVLGGASLGARRETSVTIEAFDPRAQTLTFAAPADAAVGSPVSLAATSSSGRTVSFELISGQANLDGSTLTPTAAGVITVRATQAGDDDFDPALSVERSFTAFIPASVTLTNLAQTYAATPRPVDFTSTPSGIAATISYAGLLTAPSAVGTYPVTLEVIEPFVSGSASGTLIISKASLAVRPDDQRRLVGAPNATITLGYAGFQGGETSGVIDKLPVAKTTATKSSKPGEYPITLSGGSDNSYSFNFTPGTIRVIGFGGAYEALLAPPGGGAPLGKLTLSVSATAPTFTGVLDLGDEPSPISIKGGITLDPLSGEEGDEDSVSGSWNSTALAPKNYRTTFSITGSGCVVTIYRGADIIAEGSGPRVFVPAAKTSVSWAGAYTAWLDALEPIGSDDSRPLPPGYGYAAFSVPATGAFTFAGGLPDGSKFSTPLKPDVAGGYRFFVRPQGKRAGSFVAGQLDVGGRTEQSFVWKKPKTDADPNLRAGFALDGSVTVARWQAPSGATADAAAVTLRDILGLPAETGAAAVDFSGADLMEENISTIPGGLLVTTTGKVTLDPASSLNPRKFALTIVPKTGAFSGSFILVDKRKVSFSGVLRSPSGDIAGPADIGLGFFVVPALIKGGESALGAARLIAPAPGP